MPLLSKTDAARAMGVTREGVYKAIKDGRLSVIHTADGRELINSETMREEWKRNTQARVGRGPKPPAGTRSTPPTRKKPDNLAQTTESIPDYDESRARTEHLKAELLELDRKQKESLLVRTEDVQHKWIEIVTIARTKAMGIPTKAKQRIPDLDAEQISILEDIVRETLEELSESATDQDDSDSE